MAVLPHIAPASAQSLCSKFRISPPGFSAGAAFGAVGRAGAEAARAMAPPRPVLGVVATRPPALGVAAPPTASLGIAALGVIAPPQAVAAGLYAPGVTGRIVAGCATRTRPTCAAYPAPVPAKRAPAPVVLYVPAPVMPYEPAPVVAYDALAPKLAAGLGVVAAGLVKLGWGPMRLTVPVCEAIRCLSAAAPVLTGPVTLAIGLFSPVAVPRIDAGLASVVGLANVAGFASGATGRTIAAPVRARPAPRMDGLVIIPTGLNNAPVHAGAADMGFTRVGFEAAIAAAFSAAAQALVFSHVEMYVWSSEDAPSPFSVALKDWIT